MCLTEKGDCVSHISPSHYSITFYSSIISMVTLVGVWHLWASRFLFSQGTCGRSMCKRSRISFLCLFVCSKRYNLHPSENDKAPMWKQAQMTHHPQNIYPRLFLHAALWTRGPFNLKHSLRRLKAFFVTSELNIKPFAATKCQNQAEKMTTNSPSLIFCP